MAKKTKSERIKSRKERKQKRKEKIQKIIQKIKKYVIPPQLYPFLPLMRKMLDKKGFTYDKKSPKDIVYQFYRRFIKKEHGYSYTENYDYIHFDDAFIYYDGDYVSRHDASGNTAGDATTKSNAVPIPPEAFSVIIQTVISFIKNLINKKKQGKEAELNPDEREMANDAKEIDDNPKSAELVRKLKNKEEAEDNQSEDTEEKESLIDRILRALGLKKRKTKRYLYYPFVYFEYTRIPEIENHPDNPIKFKKVSIKNKEGKITYGYKFPYISRFDKQTKLKSKKYAKDVVMNIDTEYFKHLIKTKNTEGIYTTVDNIIDKSIDKLTLAYVSAHLFLKDKINLIKVIRMLPKDYYVAIYKKIYDLSNFPQ